MKYLLWGAIGGFLLISIPFAPVLLVIYLFGKLLHWIIKK